MAYGTECGSAEELLESFKTSKWNENQTHMPKYSVLEAALVENPDFDNLDDLTPKISETADTLASEIIHYLQTI